MQSKFPFEAAVAITLPFSGALVGNYITKQNIKTWYEPKLKKPWWRPPNWLFGPVWTCLYGSMGYASFIVWRDGGGFSGHAKWPLMLYGSQLVLNWAFTPLFFGQKNLKLAFVDILALDVGIAATIWKFSEVSSAAALLMAPYLAWSLFASVLSGWIYKNNADEKRSLE